jgi:malate dehydrogenase (oxaloacetate-decarboxylating)(NADP+)
MSTIYNKAKAGKKVRIGFPEGDQIKILQAAQILRADNICEPVLYGDPKAIKTMIAEHKLEGLENVEIVDGANHPRFGKYVETFYKVRQRRGLTMREAEFQARRRNVFCTLMLHQGELDGMVTGLTMSYPEAIQAPLQIIKTRGGTKAGGVYVLVFKNDVKFLADCTVNVDPTADELAEIAVQTADVAHAFSITPKVAFLSYSNFGNAHGASPAKVRKAVELARKLRPELELDGEMQVDPALVNEIRAADYPFSSLHHRANVLVFPNLDAANIGYKLLWRLGGAEVIGPVLLNMNKPVNVLQMSADVSEIVHLAAVTALRAQGEEFAF